jgi:hypothetical protein
MLPLRPLKHDGESALSLLVRASAANGFAGPGDLCRALGLPWHSVLAGRHVARIAKAVGCDTEALRLDTGRPTPRHVVLRGEILDRRQWSVTSGRRICAACIAEDVSGGHGLEPAWARTWWDIRAVAACPIHGRTLLPACACGSDGGFNVRHLTGCRTCTGRMPRSADLSQEGAQGEVYVMGRLGVGTAIRSPILDRLPLGAAIRLLDAFADGVDECEAEDATRLSRGLRAFLDWPNGLHHHLDVIAATRQPDGSWGSENAYGPILEVVRHLDPEATADLKLEIARHAVHSGIARSAKPVLGVVVEAKDRMTLSRARGILKVGHSRARTLLVPGAGRGSGTPILLSSDVVNHLKRQRETRAALKDLQADLGIGKTQARSLVEAGIVPRGSDGKVASDAGQLVVDALLQRPTPIRATPLPKACRSARTSLADACNAILRGRLGADEILGETGLSRVGVEVQALRRIGKDTRADGLTVQEASELLGEKWQVVRDLVAARLIARDRDGKLDSRSVHQFQKGFVPGADLARRLGTSPKHLPVLAAARGVRPAIAPPMARKAFYRSADAAKLG